jgi:DNA-binding MarR family transcriptional regulator
MDRSERYVPKAQLFATRLVLFQEGIARRLDLTATDLKCLRLIQFGEATTGAELARETGLTAASVSVVIDRLNGLGYVSREQEEADRRRWRLRPVPGMIAKVDACYAEHAAIAEATLADYDAREFDVVMRFLDSFAAIFKESARALTSK